MGLWRQLSHFAQRAFGRDGEPGHGGDPGRDVEFTIAVIALGAKLAKADGVVTPEEEAAFLDVFSTDENASAHAARAFDRAGRTTLGFEGYARRLARRWRAYPAILEDVLDGLFHIAAADGVITPDEVDYIATVADIFGLSEREFRRLKASWLGAGPDDPYLILGVDADISDDDLVRAYHRAAAANHPDRFAARGLPAHMDRVAHEKMTAINAAYAQIRAERGLDGARYD